jgi:hypothetical protein
MPSGAGGGDMAGSTYEPGDDLPPPPAVAPRSGIPLVIRALFGCLVVADLLYLVGILGMARLYGLRLLAIGLPGPLYLGLVLGIVAWWHTRGPGARLWR